MSDPLFHVLSPYFPSVKPAADWKTLIDYREKSPHGRHFSGGIWEALDLSWRYFDYSDFSFTKLISCNFYNARVKGGFNKCKCENTNFSLTRFQNEESIDTVFLGCSFSGSIWEKQYSFINCLFVACDLTDVVVDTNRSFFRTVFVKCQIPVAIARRLRMLDATTVD